MYPLHTSKKKRFYIDYVDYMKHENNINGIIKFDTLHLLSSIYWYCLFLIPFFSGVLRNIRIFQMISFKNFKIKLPVVFF